MSDAMGDKNTPTSGEPIEEPAAQEEQNAAAPAAAPAQTTPQSDGHVAGGQSTASSADADAAMPDADDVTPTGSESAAPPAASAQTGSWPAASTDEASSAHGAVPEEEDTSAAQATAAARADSAQAGAPVDAPAAESKPQPDYAALAAELEEFEARQDGGLSTAADPSEPASSERTAGEPAVSSAASRTGETPAAPEGDPWFEQAPETFKVTEPPEREPETVALTPSEPVAEKPAPVFVEVLEPPRKRGNRVAALLIGLPAAIAFAVLYTIATLGWGFLTGDVTVSNVVGQLLELVSTPSFWVPTVVFYLAFWLLGVLVNRAGATAWVLLGFFVGVLAYAGYVFGPVLTHPFWMITASAAWESVQEALLHPLAIAAFVIGREVPIWFGAWVARRGRRMTELNAKDLQEYEEAAEASPEQR